MTHQWQYWLGLIILFLGIGLAINMLGEKSITSYISGVVVGQTSWLILQLLKSLRK